METAVRSRRLSANPAAGVKLPRAGKPEKTLLTHKQVTAPADAAGYRRTVILVLSYCGLRWGELERLDPNALLAIWTHRDDVAHCEVLEFGDDVPRAGASQVVEAVVAVPPGPSVPDLAKPRPDPPWVVRQW